MVEVARRRGLCFDKVLNEREGVLDKYKYLRSKKIALADNKLLYKLPPHVYKSTVPMIQELQINGFDIYEFPIAEMEKFPIKSKVVILNCVSTIEFLEWVLPLV